MNRRVVAVALGLLLVGPVFAGGFGSSAPSARIPIPAREFTATVEDQGGTTVEVTSISYNGEVYVYGLNGLGQSTIMFEKIKEIRIEPSTESGKRIMFVVGREGAPMTLVVDADVPTYGQTPYGSYTINVEHIRRITFP